MTKPEIITALDFLKEQKKSFTDWAVNHPAHPFLPTIFNDIRHFEEEEKLLITKCAEIYPTLEEVRTMSNKELLLLFRGLVAPKTHEQIEVYQYILTRIKDYTKTI